MLAERQWMQSRRARGAPHLVVERPSDEPDEADEPDGPLRAAERPWSVERGDQAFGAVMDSTSRASSSCASVSSPRSRKPSAITASRTEMRSATACLAIFAAFS